MEQASLIIRSQTVYHAIDQPASLIRHLVSEGFENVLFNLRGARHQRLELL